MSLDHCKQLHEMLTIYRNEIRNQRGVVRGQHQQAQSTMTNAQVELDALDALDKSASRLQSDVERSIPLEPGMAREA